MHYSAGKYIILVINVGVFFKKWIKQYGQHKLSCTQCLTYSKASPLFGSSFSGTEPAELCWLYNKKYQLNAMLNLRGIWIPQ